MAKHTQNEQPSDEPTVNSPELEQRPEPVGPDPHAHKDMQPAFAGGTKKKFNFKAFWGTKRGKLVCISAAVVAVLAVVFAVPVSRYAVAGLAIKKDLRVVVADNETGKPVSSAEVSVSGQLLKTDANGKVTFKNVPVGPWQVAAKKKYYQDAQGSTLVPILRDQTPLEIKIEATGRQVPLKVTNKLSGAPLANVEVMAGDSTVTTADDGAAVIVLPADQATVAASLKADGFNTLSADITVTEQEDPKNTFALTPEGKVYFLSKRTGKINVMKSDLDGANASVAVAGTGQEDESQTVLLASRDWKHLALQARRDSKAAKLYLIETATDKLSVIDEGDDVAFSPVGWSNDNFVYRVTRNTVQPWQPKQQSLKSFNATDKKIATLDDTDATGSGINSWANETYTSSYIIGDEVVFAKYWNNYFGNPALLDGKKGAIVKVKSSGGNKQAVKDFAASTSSYIEAVLYRPDEVYFRLAGSPNKYYEYHDGAVTETTEVNDTNFYNQAYATYLVSPSGKHTFWYEARDGKNVLFVGDAEGANSKEIMGTNSYKPYGWYTDDYLLLAKNGSELFALARTPNAEPVKITDYHKPAVSFPGYGYGYGGSD